MIVAGAAAVTPGISTAGSVHFKSEKLTPPISHPIGGMMISSTIDETILPNAPPMITPTAISTALPFIANSLNS